MNDVDENNSEFLLILNPNELFIDLHAYVFLFILSLSAICIDLC